MSAPSPAPIRAVLCDIDGTLLCQGRAILGAAEAVSEMRGMGVALRFLTNISSFPPERLAVQLSRQGVEVGADEVETSVSACAAHLGREPDAGVWLLVPDAVRHLFEGCRQAVEKPDVVVVTDVRDGFTFAAMNEAYGKLMAGARLVAPHRNMYCFEGNGQRLDAGAFVAALEAATGRTATVTGKPSPVFFREALRRIGRRACETLVVGDDVLTDVRGASDSGMRSVLVETGKGATRPVPDGPHSPTWVRPSIAALPDLIRSLNALPARNETPHA